MTSTKARPDTMTFSIDEWFVVTLARTIKDREAVFHGLISTPNRSSPSSSKLPTATAATDA